MATTATGERAEFEAGIQTVMANLDQLSAEQRAELRGHLLTAREQSEDPEERAKLELLAAWVSNPGLRARLAGFVHEVVTASA